MKAKGIYRNLKLEASVCNYECGKNSENVRKIIAKGCISLNMLFKKNQKTAEICLLSVSKPTYDL